MSDKYDFDDILPGKKRDILSELVEIENMEDPFFSSDSDSSDTIDIPEPRRPEEDTSFLPSLMLKKKEKEKKKRDLFKTEEYDPDQWFADMMGKGSIKLNKSKGRNSVFDEFGIKKKKKKGKKKEKSDIVDYKKEFEPEMALFRNLLIDQNRFTDDLQKEFDSIKSVKSSSRGVPKQLADLIENITDARTLSMQLVEKNVNAKKMIAELTLKQKKEMGALNGESENMADFASSYMKKLLSERNQLLSGSGDNSIQNYNNPDEIFDVIADSLEADGLLNDTEETDLYLKYENSNITVYVVIEDNDIENYTFRAIDDNDIEVLDYPMPLRSKISVNRSTNIATDEYGKKFPIIWEEANKEAV